MRKFFLQAQIRSVPGQADDIFEVVVSSNSVDRHGEVVVQAGIDFTKWMQNPVFLWAHDYSAMPVAKGLAVTVENGQTVVQGQWAPAEANPQSAFLKALWKGGFLNATSIGFIENMRDGNQITESEILEVSFVPVPANADALALVRTLAFSKTGETNEKVFERFFETKKIETMKKKAWWTDAKFIKDGVPDIEAILKEAATKDAEDDEMDAVMEALQELSDTIGEAMDETDTAKRTDMIEEALEECMEACKEALDSEAEGDEDEDGDDEMYSAIMDALKEMEESMKEAMGGEEEGMGGSMKECIKEAMDKIKDAMDDSDDEEGSKGLKIGAAISAKNREMINKSIKLMTKAFGHSTKAHGHMEDAIASLEALVKGYDEEDEEEAGKGASKERSIGGSKRAEYRAWLQTRTVVAAVAHACNEALREHNKSKP